MKFEAKKIKGYSCPSKWLLLIDKEPVCFANSESRVGYMIAFVEGFNDGIEVKDGSILRLLQGFKEKYKEVK
jgi:hypothetical protein